MFKKTLILLLLTASPMQSAAGEIDKMLRSMLAPGAPAPTEVEFLLKVVAQSENLTASEVSDLVPLAQKAIHDSRPAVREFGLKFLLAVVFRHDSAELLAPCEADLERVVTAKGDPLKRLALTIIVFLHPRVPPDLVTFLSAHLQDPDNAPEDAGLEAVAVVQEGDPDLVHKVILFLNSGDHPFVSAEVVQKLGLMGTRNPEALAFIEASLSSPSGSVRWEAASAVFRLPQMEQTRFLSRLNQMAVDPNEDPNLRSHILDEFKH